MPLLDAPILLFCSERSGSNLIGKIFDAHPQVCSPGASHLFKVMAECACRYVPGSDALRAAVLDLFEAKVSQWRIDALTRPDRAALLAGHDTAGEMAAALYAAEARQAGKPHVLTKENSAFAYLPMLLGQSWAPRVLFMVRDPRDMAVSWVNGPVMRGGVLRASARWVYDQTGFLTALSQLPAATPASFLRYEDLLEDPETELRRVCAGLSLDFAPSMLRFQEASTSARADAKRSAMWSNLDKALIRNNRQKFLTELDDDEIAYVEASAGPLLTGMGYASARDGKPEFGRFDTLQALKAHLSDREPHDKPAYQALPQEERARFEGWSRLYRQMTARPPVPPARLLGKPA